jgi:probable HAF family extracellular repeat protein
MPRIVTRLAALVTQGTLNAEGTALKEAVIPRDVITRFPLAGRRALPAASRGTSVTWRWCVTAALLLNGIASHARAQPPIDLGALGPGGSWASAINEAGQVVGRTYTDDDRSHAFLWTAAKGMTDLGTLGGTESWATSVNASGDVVGTSATRNGEYHAFRWTRGSGMTDLGTLGGTSSYPAKISDSGYVVGTSTTADGSEHAFLWTPSSHMVDLGVLPGCSSSWAIDVNVQGQVVGRSCFRGFSWTAATGMVGLGAPSTDSGATAVNDSGQVVGWMAVDANNWIYHAFLWTAAHGIRDLGTLPGFPSSFANGTNSGGQVIGTIRPFNPEMPPTNQAFVWSAARGMLRLSAPTYGATPTGINRSGQVVGYTFSYMDTMDDDHQAVFWTPAGKLIHLSGINASAFSTMAMAVNDHGEIIGNSDGHALMWKPVEKGSVAATYVRAGQYASTNFGTARTLATKKGVSPDNTRRGYLKFDIADIRPDDTVMLRLNVRLSNASGPSVETTVYAVPDVSWDERTVTWNTRPALGAVLGRITVTETVSRTFMLDITKFIQQERQAGRNMIALALRNVGHTSASVIVDSRESDMSRARPALLVTAAQ